MEVFINLSDRFLEKELKTLRTSTAKMEWLRSQIIGNHVEFGTPFGKRLLTYADHTASGRSLQVVENFILDIVLPVYGNTHTEDTFVGMITGNAVQEAQNYVKACMGGKVDDVVLFPGSGSTAAIKKLQEVMGIAVPSILRDEIVDAIDERHRWVVFVGPYEHHSNLLTWRQSLAEVVEIPLSDKGVVDIMSLEVALQDSRYRGRPKLGSFSAGSNVTGILSDTRLIARVLHAHGAFACFDFAACAPYVKIDTRSDDADGYDAIFVSPHKFMGGPGSCGILLLNKKLYLLRNSPPSTCGGGTVDFVNFYEQSTIYYDDIEQREDAGTPPIIQKIRTALVYCVKEFLTPEFILARETYFIRNAMARLGSNPNIILYGPTGVERLAILAFGVHRAGDRPGDSSKVSFIKSTVSLPKQSTLKFKLRSLKNNYPKLVTPEFMTGCSDLVSSSPSKRSVPRSVSPMQRKTENVQDETQIPANKRQATALHGRFIVKLLSDLFGIQARGGCSCAAPYGHNLLGVDMKQSLALRVGIKQGYASVKPGWARLSFGYYISQHEFEFILSAIEFVAEFGARFLQLYDLNWSTGEWTFKQHNEKVKDMIVDAELQVFGKQRKSMWTKRPQLPAPRLYFNSSFNVNSLGTDDYYSKLMSNYLKMAKYLANCLPPNPSKREIPHDLDPALITFII